MKTCEDLGTRDRKETGLTHLKPCENDITWQLGWVEKKQFDDCWQIQIFRIHHKHLISTFPKPSQSILRHTHPPSWQTWHGPCEAFKRNLQLTTYESFNFRRLVVTIAKDQHEIVGISTVWNKSAYKNILKPSLKPWNCCNASLFATLSHHFFAACQSHLVEASASRRTLCPLTLKGPLQDVPSRYVTLKLCCHDKNIRITMKSKENNGKQRFKILKS